MVLGGESLRCIIVDDSPEFRTVAAVLLRRGGIAVVGGASNSTEALRQVAELTPDVAIVDVHLGEESGFVLADQLHQHDTTVILISSYSADDFVDMLPTSSAVGFLSKSDLSAAAVEQLLADG